MVRLEELEREALFQRLFKRVFWNTRSIYNDFLQPNFRVWDWGGISKTTSGEDVSVSRAEKLSTVYNSINLISQTIAALPFVVKEKREGGKFDASKHPAYDLLKNKPNRFMTSLNFWMVVIRHLLGWGNSYVLIKKDDLNRVTELVILDPSKMTIDQDGGEVFYTYGAKQTVFAPEDLLHFKMNSKDGIVGISPIMENAETIGAHIKQTNYSAKMLGEKPPGYLTDKTPRNVSGGASGKKRKDDNTDAWKKQVKDKGIAYLDGDIQYVPLMLPPDEAQYIETRKLTKLEIMAMFRTPPELHQVYENSNYSLSESTAINFGKYCLTPIVTCIEQEVNSKLFSLENKQTGKEYFLKANMNAIYRADLKTTGEFMQMMHGMGIYNADRVLSLLDENPQPEGQGQIYYIQSGFIPKHMAEDFWKSKEGSRLKDPAEAAKELSTEDLLEIYLRKVEEGKGNE